MSNEPDVSNEEVVAHVKKLLTVSRIPELTPELDAIADMGEVHSYLVELRSLLGAYSKGGFSQVTTLRGVLAGMLKALQANMNHLVWQLQRVEEGDFTQRVDFMGDFSRAFNNMVIQLDTALTSLKMKEQELTTLTRELEREVEKRDAAMSALQKSQETFKYLAEHDPLTGLLNRRSFFARAEMELARNGLLGKPCAIALMDVDHFKIFNDTYGHQNGDIALKHTAECGKSALRDSDIMGRYGGEEFIFFFSQTTLEHGQQAAERIRKAIEASPVKLAEKAARLTASLGVTAIPPDIHSDSSLNTLEFAVGMADAALYRAKSRGRNQVCTEVLPAFVSDRCELPLPKPAGTEAEAERAAK